MKLHKVYKKYAELSFSEKDCDVIKYSISIAISELSDEIQTRIGASEDEIISLKEKITNEDSKEKIKLNKLDLFIINSILSEVLYGFYIDDFDKKIKCSKNYAKRILDKANAVYEEITNGPD